jgi:cytochrome c553
VSTSPTEPKSGNDSPFGRQAAALVIALVIAGWLLGFVAMPLIQGRGTGLDVFTAICRAMGFARRSAVASAASLAPPSSQVAWTVATLDDVTRGDSTAGATVAADSCIACHDPNGLSAGPAIPSMSGQSARAIYKQLSDFKSGARVNPAMAPIIAGLTPQQMVDVAAYYSRLPRRNADIASQPDAGATMRHLVTNGDSTRAIPACDACHQSFTGGPLEAPQLTGQYPDYTAAQLRAFADHSRHNDLYGRMRVIAGKLTDTEVSALALYYDAPR